MMAGPELKLADPTSHRMLGYILGSDVLALDSYDVRIDTLIFPIFQVAKPPSIRVHNAEVQLNSLEWCDHAFAHRWDDAILAYLRLHSREFTYVWALVNAIAAESLPPNRTESRRRKVEILRSVADLRRQRKIFRWRRKFFACVEV